MRALHIIFIVCNMKYLRPKEQALFLKAIHKRPLNECIVYLFALHTGLRLNENLSLKIDDVDGKESFWVRTLKRSDHILREVPIVLELRPMLEAYIEAWKSVHSPKHNPKRMLFISRRGTPVSSRYVQHVLTLIFKELGMEEFHFHSLRHTCCKNLVRAGVPLPSIQKWMGHKSLDATAAYLEPDREELFEAAEMMNNASSR